MFNANKAKELLKEVHAYEKRKAEKEEKKKKKNRVVILKELSSLVLDMAEIKGRIKNSAREGYSETYLDYNLEWDLNYHKITDSDFQKACVPLIKKLQQLGFKVEVKYWNVPFRPPDGSGYDGGQIKEYYLRVGIKW